MKQLSFLFIICLFLLAGCTVPQDDGHYTAEFPYDPLQYMTFLNKEINVVQNQLNSSVSLTVMVTRGEYPAGQAAESIQESLDVIKAVYTAVDVMRPPVKYVDTRERLLRLLRSVEDDCDRLIQELQKPAPDNRRLIEIKNLLLGHSTAISSLANIYWV